MKADRSGSIGDKQDSPARQDLKHDGENVVGTAVSRAHCAWRESRGSVIRKNLRKTPAARTHDGLRRNDRPSLVGREAPSHLPGVHALCPSRILTYNRGRCCGDGRRQLRAR